MAARAYVRETFDGLLSSKLSSNPGGSLTANLFWKKNIRPKLDDWTIFPNYKGVKGLASLRIGTF